MSPYLPRVKLQDVVDLEAQLALDEGADESVLAQRDRALVRDLAPAPAAPATLLSAWLERLRETQGGPRAGERVEIAQRILGYALAIVGLSSGWGLAEVLLHYEQGGAPVNVGYFLFVLVLGQLATLLLLVLGLVLHRVAPRLPLVGDLSRLLRFVVARLGRLVRDHSREASERIEAERAALARVRGRLGLYRRLEQSMLLSHTQLFAICFNVGVLASCLRLVLLSDLAFGWSTSVTALDAGQVHQLVRALSWPFAFLVPDAVPSPALIEHTQYFRLEGRFAGAEAGTRGDPRLVAGWWRFLIACTVTYGLLPRLVTFAVFRRQKARAEREVPLDTPAVQRVLARLRTPALSTQAGSVAQRPLEPARALEPAASSDPSPHAPTALVLYRDLPTEPTLLAQIVGERLGLVVTSVDRAGGLDVKADAALCERLGAGKQTVALVAEAWEAPDKSLRTFLSTLRTRTGPQRTLRVVLIGEARTDGFAAPSPDDVRVYRDRLSLLSDPYLSIEPLAEASAPRREEV